MREGEGSYLSRTIFLFPLIATLVMSAILLHRYLVISIWYLLVFVVFFDIPYLMFFMFDL